ncbi:MAG: M23 family metallopeptidase [Xanthomonadaceae bacterium]|jgi:murein DD-endopeptidase MepM/ murein hydrolase activator NlpD|nr:M23 family metallopeptidase [Xanthomonadaceae bacterium]
MPNIIVVSRHLRSPWTLRLEEPRNRAFAVAALAAAVLLIATAGWAFGRWVAGDGLAPLRAEVQAGAAAVEAARAEARREVNALAARVGELQAQANRLNALGQRLTELGGVAAGEFDFSERPGVGGPEQPASAAAPDLGASLGEVESAFARAERQLDVLGALLEGEQLAAAARPSHAPAPGYISSGFGFRADPFTGARSHHFGVDFDANIGDPVRAAAAGIVSFSGWKPGYGHTVVVDHGDGYQTLYAHNQKNLVAEGELVRAGQQIAKVGSSGRSTGSHLHFEVHVNGRPVNPMAYLERLRR